MRVIIFVAVLGIALAVPRSGGNRIVGGSDTTVEQYPFMTNMQFGSMDAGYSQACGGALITENVVLSAAHCFEWASNSAWWRACLGTTFRSACTHAHILSAIIMHERFNSITVDNDIAIVKLATAATLSANVQLARIAGPNYVLPDGTSITAMGWGNTQYQGERSEQLQHVDLDVINHELCAERYAYLKTQPGFTFWPDITDGMLCAGILDVGGKDACQGDSGGPVVHDGDVVVGVTSWGYECAHSFYPGVLARVSHYTEWIVGNA